jgi:hypothetical protein
MKRINSIFRKIVQSRSIILAVSLINLIYISSEAFEWNRGPGGPSFPAFSEWYEKDAFIHVPMLFVAAFCLLISQKWSYLSAIFLSGYVVIYGLIHFATRTITFFEEWNWIRSNERNLLLEWNLQFILAAIIFGFAIFYSVSDIKKRRNLFQ